MLQLSPAQRKYLRSLAHDLKPVVMIGSSGLTEAVMRETARSLAAHELVKIRVLDDDRVQRDAHMLAICEALGAAPVQHIGKLLLIYRPAEPPRIQLP